MYTLLKWPPESACCTSVLPPFLVPASQLLSHAMDGVCAILRQKTVFNFAPKPVLHCLCGNVQGWILASVERLHCVRGSHIAINQPKLSDASRSSPLTIVSDICCMIYWSPPTLQHSKPHYEMWFDVAKPHYQMWFDVAAEVNAGSDHIADHTGPDRGAK